MWCVCVIEEQEEDELGTVFGVVGQDEEGEENGGFLEEVCGLSVGWWSPVDVCGATFQLVCFVAFLLDLDVSHVDVGKLLVEVGNGVFGFRHRQCHQQLLFIWSAAHGAWLEG